MWHHHEHHYLHHYWHLVDKQRLSITVFDNVSITSIAGGVNIGAVLLWSLCITGNKIAISKVKRSTNEENNIRLQSGQSCTFIIVDSMSINMRQYWSLVPITGNNITVTSTKREHRQTEVIKIKWQDRTCDVFLHVHRCWCYGNQH